MRNPHKPDVVASDIKQFALSFVYYFCTSAGPDPSEPVPEEAMVVARNRMHNTVKGNKTLEIRLEGFTPRWREGVPPSQRDTVGVPATTPIAKVTIPPRLRASLEQEMVEILGWGGDDTDDDDDGDEDLMDLGED